MTMNTVRQDKTELEKNLLETRKLISFFLLIHSS